MRAWPRIVLTSAAQAVGEGRSHRVRRGAANARRESTLWRMILSFGPDAAGRAPWPLALGLRWRRWPTRCGAGRGDGERCGGLRVALLVGWIAHGAGDRRSTSPASARRVPGARFGFAPALSVTLWLVLAVYALESRFVPLPGARRALALLGVGVVVLRLAVPGRGASAGGVAAGRRCTGCSASRSYGLFGVAVLHALLLDRAERQHAPRAAARRRRPRWACRCCGWSG